MGWGAYGAIESDDFNEPDGTFHRGKNIFKKIHYNMLIYTMNEDALDLEAMDWAGDSGGPAFIEVDGTDKIAGVNSNGSCCYYGDEDEFTRLGSTFAYAWIEANIADSGVGNGVSIGDCTDWQGASYIMMGHAVLASLFAYLAF